MTIIICPQCRRKLKIRPEHATKKLRCTSCNHVFRPDADGSAQRPRAAATSIALMPNLVPEPVVAPGETVEKLQAKLHRELSVRAVLEANHAEIVAAFRQKEK